MAKAEADISVYGHHYSLVGGKAPTESGDPTLKQSHRQSFAASNSAQGSATDD